MVEWRCRVDGTYDPSSPDAFPEVFGNDYRVEAASRPEAEAAAAELAAGDFPGGTIDKIDCKQLSLLAIEEASEAQLKGRTGLLERAARLDGATDQEIADAKKANPHWPPE